MKKTAQGSLTSRWSRNFRWLGFIVAGLLVLGIIASIIPLFLSSYSGGETLSESLFSVLSERWVWKVVWFSVYQAVLSTLLSVLPAIFIARALMRQSFVGREWLIKLMALPLVIPAIVVVFAIIEVYGRQGWLNTGLNWLGLAELTRIYGLKGILLAHVFFNLPLAIYLLLSAWQMLPNTLYKNAEQVGMNDRQLFLTVEWPYLKSQLFPIALLIFLLCFGSFTIVLTLGGSPSTTTLEVAIYQHIKFAFNPQKAAFLAAIQMLLCFSLGAWWLKQTDATQTAKPQIKTVVRFDGSGWHRWIDYGLIIMVALFVGLPLLAILAGGLNPEGWGLLFEKTLWQAVNRSVLLALLSASIACVLGSAVSYAMVSSQNFSNRRFLELVSLLGFIAPPVILGAGWFLLVFRWFGGLSSSVLLVIFMHIFITLPYAIRTLTPSMEMMQHSTRLASMLDIRGKNYWQVIAQPMLRVGLIKTFALGFCLSMGDLGAVALFAHPETPTLPLLMYELLGRYRVTEAGVVAALLLLICVGVYLCIEKIWGEKRANRY